MPRCSAHLKTGDRVVASRALFGSCHWIVSTLLPRYGITTPSSTAPTSRPGARALATPAAVVLLELPVESDAGDTSTCVRSADLAHAAGALVVVDNVFATPLLQQPFELGADIVVYSCTKHIDGQGRVLGGAVLGRRPGSKTRCSRSSATPAPACRRSTPGCC